jgi:fused signal recognition particle receptor
MRSAPLASAAFALDPPPLTLPLVFVCFCSRPANHTQVVDELFAYWTLEKSEDALEELEEALIAADFGPRTALKVVDGVRDEVRAGRAKGPADLKAALKRAVVAALTPAGEGAATLNLAAADTAPPAVVMIVGVNGGGKTTTLGKLAHRLGAAGGNVMLAAGDTYRAAAAEQLAGWAGRAGAQFYGPAPGEGGAGGARPDAVLFRAVAAARAGGADVLLCDTSGRLHTNGALMAELAKCARSLGKAAPGAPHETLLVLDGTTGLNMVAQAREFNETVPLSGLVVTKLDGTARGGAVVGAVAELGVPIKFVGVGEGVEDLQPFDAASFVDALFPE